MNYGTKPPFYMNINETWPIGGIEICSRRPVVQATLLVGGTCPVTQRDGLWRVSLPPVDGYQAVRLRLAPGESQSLPHIPKPSASEGS
jgi:hypothetical protein